MLEVPVSLDAATLERALGVVVEHHDALRLRFEQDGQQWHQHHAEAGYGVGVEQVDLREVPGAELANASRPARRRRKWSFTSRTGRGCARSGSI